MDQKKPRTKSLKILPGGLKSRPEKTNLTYPIEGCRIRFGPIDQILPENWPKKNGLTSPEEE